MMIRDEEKRIAGRGLWLARPAMGCPETGPGIPGHLRFVTI